MNSKPMSSADATAFARLVACQPAWTGVVTAAEVLDLPPRTLLHAGPPASPAHALVTPTLHSAAVACVLEGWATTLEQGLELVRAGAIGFAAAQDHRVATPMAAVVSPSMQLLVFTDTGVGAGHAYAPINGGGTGGGPAPRYGRCTQAALDLQRFLNDEVATLLMAAVAEEPLPWLPIVDAALLAGDDLHLKHVAAHARVLGELDARLGERMTGAGAAFMREWPIFHLNFWMAAGRCVLDAAAGVPGSALVTAMGGNGAEFGLKVSGLPSLWFTCTATPPLGRLREPHVLTDCVGAYGDSALVEALGLGAMAHAYCPDMRAFHADYYHADMDELPARLLLGAHPSLHASGAWVGLSARQVVEQGVTPVVELGIVDKAGQAGGLGAGLYRPPLTPFADAVQALSAA